VNKAIKSRFPLWQIKNENQDLSGLVAEWDTPTASQHEQRERGRLREEGEKEGREGGREGGRGGRADGGERGKLFLMALQKFTASVVLEPWCVMCKP
jgi:hypothetical protein